MIGFLLWCLLLVLCWPLALLALILYPIVWLLLLPFRILGIAVDGILAFLRACSVFRRAYYPGRAKSDLWKSMWKSRKEILEIRYVVD